jgi:hypothetical protein
MSIYLIQHPDSPANHPTTRLVTVPGCPTRYHGAYALCDLNVHDKAGISHH